MRHTGISVPFSEHMKIMIYRQRNYRCGVISQNYNYCSWRVELLSLEAKQSGLCTTSNKTLKPNCYQRSTRPRDLLNHQYIYPVLLSWLKYYFYFLLQYTPPYSLPWSIDNYHPVLEYMIQHFLVLYALGYTFLSFWYGVQFPI